MKKTQTITLSQSEYASLKQEVERLRLHAEQAQRDRLEAEAKAAQLEAEKAVLKQALEEERARLLKVIKAFVVRRSERYKAQDIPDGQLSLFAEQLLNLSQSPQAQKINVEARRKPGTPKRKHPGHRPIPEHLPRIDVILEPEEDMSTCVKIGEEIIEELDYMPGYFMCAASSGPNMPAPINKVLS